MGRKLIPPEENQFQRIKKDTKEKYLKIGVLHFCRNYSYDDLVKEGYGSRPTIAEAIRYFTYYFDNPSDKASLIGAIEDIRVQVKDLKQDLNDLRTLARRPELNDIAKSRYYTQIAAVAGRVKDSSELLYKLQGLLIERIRGEIEGPEEMKDELYEGVIIENDSSTNTNNPRLGQYHTSITKTERSI